ncbi:MAG: VCBS repeat-containing protein [Deltaproteobacteria bacterium]|nr:VCBS repeat-containing protein [Deltaproteobacteria bacterium]
MYTKTRSNNMGMGTPLAVAIVFTVVIVTAIVGFMTKSQYNLKLTSDKSKGNFRNFELSNLRDQVEADLAKIFSAQGRDLLMKTQTVNIPNWTFGGLKTTTGILGGPSVSSVNLSSTQAPGSFELTYAMSKDDVYLFARVLCVKCVTIDSISNANTSGLLMNPLSHLDVKLILTTPSGSANASASYIVRLALPSDYSLGSNSDGLSVLPVDYSKTIDGKLVNVVSTCPTDAGLNEEYVSKVAKVQTANMCSGGFSNIKDSNTRLSSANKSLAGASALSDFIAASAQLNAAKTIYMKNTGDNGSLATEIISNAPVDFSALSKSHPELSSLLTNDQLFVGTGLFDSNTTLTANVSICGIETANFNSDDVSDIVVARNNSNTVSVYSSNSDGSYNTPVDYTVGSGPFAVTTADLRNNGRKDIITADFYDNTASILLSNGDGTFAARTIVAVGTHPRKVTLSDVNHDGVPDLISSGDSPNLTVALGNGSGGFLTPTTYPISAAGNYEVQISDMNGDGKPDVVVASTSDEYVSTLLGNGDGTFQARTNFVVPFSARGLALSDFDGDGKKDIAVAGNGTVSIYAGNGAGSYTLKNSMSVGANLQTLKAMDINNDGKSDLVIADRGITGTGNSIFTLFGNGNGNFTNSQTLTVGNDVRFFSISDLQSHGALDVISSDYASGTISIRRGAVDLDKAAANLSKVAGIYKRALSALNDPEDGVSTSVVQVATVDLSSYACPSASAAPISIPALIGPGVAKLKASVESNVTSSATKMTYVSCPSHQATVSLNGDQLRTQCVALASDVQAPTASVSTVPRSGTIVYATPGTDLVVTAPFEASHPVTLIASSDKIFVNAPITSKKASVSGISSASSETSSCTNANRITADCFSYAVKSLDGAARVGLVADTVSFVAHNNLPSIVSGKISASVENLGDLIPNALDSNAVVQVAQAHIVANKMITEVPSSEAGAALVSGSPKLLRTEMASMNKGSILIAGTATAEVFATGQVLNTGSCQPIGASIILQPQNTRNSTCTTGSQDCAPLPILGTSAGPTYTVSRVNYSVGAGMDSSGPNVLAAGGGAR